MAVTLSTASVILPAGTTAQRPASPAAGMIRYNTSLGIIEAHNGSTWMAGLGATSETAAPSGKAIKQYYPDAPSGVYWLKGAAGAAFQAYIKMDYGGGWINMSATMGPYTSVITGSGAGNLFTGWVTSGDLVGNGVLPANGGFANQNGGDVYGCGGETNASRLYVSNAFKTDFGITEVRYRFQAQQTGSGVTCYYMQPNTNIISGSWMNFSVCNNSPNRWDQVNPSSYYAEAYGNLYTRNQMIHWYTSCTGNANSRIVELYLR
jgi:hypothetical protein